MSEWHEISERELAADEEARLAKQLAYYNVFYRTDDGRAVQADLRRRVYSSGDLEPVALLAAIELLEYIRESCGVKDMKKIVDAEASIPIEKGFVDSADDVDGLFAPLGDKKDHA